MGSSNDIKRVKNEALIGDKFVVTSGGLGGITEAAMKASSKHVDEKLLQSVGQSELGKLCLWRKSTSTLDFIFDLV